MLQTLIAKRAAEMGIPDMQRMTLYKLVCKSGFDQLKVKIRGNETEFFLAGYDVNTVYVVDSIRKKLHQFGYKDLDTLVLAEFEQLVESINDWLDGTYANRAKSLNDHIAAAVQRSLPLPVTAQLLSEEGKQHSLPGTINYKSDYLGSRDTTWVCAIEFRAELDVHRYGISSMNVFRHQGSSVIVPLRVNYPTSRSNDPVVIG